MRVQFPHGSLTTAKWWNWDTRDAQNVVPFAAWEFESPLGYLKISRVSQCSVRPHKPCLSGATPEPAMTRYANWQSGEVESLVIVGSTPTLVTFDRVVQRLRRLVDIQEREGSIPSAST